MNADHFTKLKHIYLSSNINTQIYESNECEITYEKATITMTIAKKYFHAFGAIHGSVYFKLLDDAAFFAVNSIIEDVFVLTTSFNIRFLRPVSIGKLTAIGKVTSKTQKGFVAESTLYNEAGKKVAFGTGLFVKSKMRLTQEIGYC
jgi:uncharacterized protein (TIGR00369 family)